MYIIIITKYIVYEKKNVYVAGKNVEKNKGNWKNIDLNFKEWKCKKKKNKNKYNVLKTTL